MSRKRVWLGINLGNMENNNIEQQERDKKAMQLEIDKIKVRILEQEALIGALKKRLVELLGK